MSARAQRAVAAGVGGWLEWSERLRGGGGRAGRAQRAVERRGKGKGRPASDPADIRRYNLSAHLDPHNTGVLLVDLTGGQQNGRTRDAGGLVDDLDRQQEGECVIM